MVLYINGNYPYHSLHSELAAKLTDMGNEITVFVPLSTSYKDEEERSRHPGFTVRYCKNIGSPDRVFFIHKIHKIVKAVEDSVDMTRVDCILAGTVYSDGAAAYLLHKKYGIPFSVVVRQTDVCFQMKWRPYLNGFIKRLLDQASRIVFITPTYRRVIDKFGCDRGKYTVIPNAVNDYWFSQPPVKRKLHEPVSLIYVGEISKRKNVSTTIMAVNELKKRGVTVNYHIVGSGDQEDNCRALAESLGVKEQVFFHGWQKTKEKIRSFYELADIFVMPSLMETFGTVYIEALSQGLPVIYTRNQGIDGYFEQGTVGYSCDPTNIKEIVSAIIAITDNYDAISAACVSEAGRFRWDSAADGYDKVIKDMRNI